MTSQQKTPSIRERAAALAEKTADAYSADAFGNSWVATCAMLLRRGYTEREAEAILRSKWTRWARDMGSKYEGNSKTLERFLDARPAKGRPSMFKSDEDLARQVRELTAETFGEV